MQGPMQESCAPLPWESRGEESVDDGLRVVRQRLEHCLSLDCDIDPMILRARTLRQRGSRSEARWLEEELLPLF